MSTQAFSKLFSEKDGSQLKELTEKYPWCSVAQLLLLQHYKKNNPSQFEGQAAKTALFFNNTNWLNWQLHRFWAEEITDETKPENPAAAHADEHSTETLTQSLTNIKAEADTKETQIAFEPLHTTDYFASQGIKLTDEPVTNDKLGTQLKSFTEWLKSMKKINTETLPGGDAHADKTIQQIAEHSNVETDVVTEAMAEVLIKQGKTDKAVEVYRKLSLINPSKSAYFAAKINSLS